MSGVSVVIPTYNRADLLRLTLQSVLGQTVAPLEVIVVDDGSTDHTAQVCAEFGDFVQYLRQKNQRLPAARNAGIRAARGEWIALCDSDDLWQPHKLEMQLAALNATGAAWSITDFGIIDPDGNRSADDTHGFRHAFPVFEEIDITPKMHFGRWLDEREIQLGSDRIKIYTGDAFGMLFEGNIALPSTSTISRVLLDKAGLFETTFRAEETEFFHRIAASGTVAIVMKPLTDYRVGHPSLIKGDATPFIQDALRSLELAAALRPTLSAKERSAFREGRRRLLLRLAYSRLSSLDRAGARQALYEAWHEDPILSPRSTAIMVASLLPETALRGLHWAKRAMRNQLS
ncbi:MAG: glycosyltransferase [Gemmatimonadota bacterium]|nr:glycosyltransferase [Gemmatimonadota bacterium]